MSVSSCKIRAWLASCGLHVGLAYLLYAHGARDTLLALRGGGSEPMRLDGLAAIASVREPPPLLPVDAALLLAATPIVTSVEVVAEAVEQEEREEFAELAGMDRASADEQAMDAGVSEIVEAPSASPLTRMTTGLCAKLPSHSRSVAGLGVAIASAPPPAPERDGMGDSLHGEGGDGGGQSQVAMAASPAVDGSRCKAPRYPPKARRLGLEGVVIIELEVQADGKIVAVRLVESSGHELLDQEALKTLATWQCFPARTASGDPITGKLRVPVRFQLTQAQSS